MEVIIITIHPDIIKSVSSFQLQQDIMFITYV